MQVTCSGVLMRSFFFQMCLNFGKSTILAHLTYKIFSSEKQPLNLKFYAIMVWIHSGYIKLQGVSQKYSKSILCSWQYQVEHKHSNCFMHDEMVDFPKFGHKCRRYHIICTIIIDSHMFISFRISFLGQLEFSIICNLVFKFV